MNLGPGIIGIIGIIVFGLGVLLWLGLGIVGFVMTRRASTPKGKTGWLITAWVATALGALSLIGALGGGAMLMTGILN